MGTLLWGAVGCTDWLEISDPGLAIEPAEDPMNLDHVGLPTQRARVDGLGGLVPGTPGLRVPRGYATHARLDSADFLLPYTWAAVDTTRSQGPRPASRITLRIVATEGIQGESPPSAPTVRAVFPLALPEGTALEELAGLTVRGAALAEARVGIRTSGEHHWLVTPTRLSIDEVTPTAIKGSFQGEARRGARSDRVRTFLAGFVALRAPDR